MQDLTLVDLLLRRAAHTSNHKAYTYLVDGAVEEINLTYGTLDMRARSIAALLQRTGRPGQRVLLFYPPGLEYIAAFFGCLYAGMIAVPSYPPRLNRPDARLQAIVADARATAALTTQQILTNFEQRFADTPDLAALRWSATDQLPEDALSDLARQWQPPALTGDSLAFLQYTSGSTARPRGVMVTHANILHNQLMIKEAFGHTEQTTVAGWLPLYHDMGLIGNVLQPLYLGTCCILMSPVTFLQNPILWLRAISRYRASTSGGANFAYDLCVRQTTDEQRAGLDLSSWQVAFNGAEPVRYETLEQFAAAFAHYGFRRTAFYPCYGLAEATLFVTGGSASAPPVAYAVQKSALARGQALPAGADVDSPMLVGCGRSWQAQNIAIVEPNTLTRCPDGQVGEIWVSGPHVAQGYWEKPEATAQTFQAYLADQGPFLRSGDVGFLKDGELFVTGRKKDLIVIRGHNYYPQDIEYTAQQSHPALEANAGAAFSVELHNEERLVVVQELKRSHYRSVGVEEVAAAVRQAVAEEYELQVYAVVLIKPMSLPKTSSGKVQRYATRTAFLEGQLHVIGSNVLDAVADAGPDDQADLTGETLRGAAAEERRPLLLAFLRTRAARALRIAPDLLDLQQPLVGLGLDSLAAAELQSDFRARFDVAIPVEELLRKASIAQIAAWILAQLDLTGQALPQGQPLLARTGTVALSFEQERLWALTQLSSNDPAYHIAIALRLTGALDVPLLERSLQELGRRHDILRAGFQTTRGYPQQTVASDTRLPFLFENLGALPGDQRERCHLSITAQVRRPFDLAQGPLMRVLLLRLAETEHILVLTMHHLISDLQSVAVLLREWAALYQVSGREQTAPLPEESAIQYADFAHWQREHLRAGSFEAGLSFWEQRLAGAPQLLLPTDRPRPTSRSYRGAHYYFDILPGLCASLRAVSQEEQVTLFMALLAAFEVVLCSYTKQTDILLGSPVGGRLHPGTQHAIGFFAYPLILRTNLAGDPTFREVLGRVRDVTLEAYAHQDIPFAAIVKRLRPERRGRAASLFQMMFGLARSPTTGLSIDGLALEPFDIETGALDLDLFLTMVEEPGGLRGVLAYATDLFEADTIRNLAAFYTAILEQAVQHPDTRLSEFALPDALSAKAAQIRRREQQYTVALAATFTAEPVRDALSFWLPKMDLPPRVEFAPYNQVFQQLLDPASLLSRNEKGVNVVLVRLEDWQSTSEQSHSGKVKTPEESIRRNVHDLVQALRAAAARSTIPYLLCVCPASPARRAEAPWAAFAQHIETALAAEVAPINGVYLVTWPELARLYPVANYYDRYADELGRIPYTPAFFTALGTMIARRIYALQQPPYKVIVLDCDQTLWQGVCGEDGALGIEVDRPRQALQAFMVAQHRAGMLLCLCSKNNEADVFEVFERRPEMPLKREHIVAWRINWRPKSENIKALAQELRLGLDSFILIEDNPVECAEVQANCPEVLTLTLPAEPANIPRFLDHVWAFDHLKVTAADRERTATYRQNAARERLREAALTFEGFLAGLELEVEITAMLPEQQARVAQLTQRTNQFNVSPTRRTESEIRHLAESRVLEGWVVNARDRFGDYGLVGLILFKTSHEAIEVDTFLLSCRALGREIEQRMLAWLGEIARTRGLDYVIVAYLPTPKNKPALDFLTSVGAAFKQANTTGWMFRFPAESIAILPNQVMMTGA